MTIETSSSEVEADDCPKKVLGWTRASRGVLVAICIAASLALRGTLPETAPIEPLDLHLVVDPNDAPPAVLMALPRLGPSLVGRIVMQREIRPFDSMDDLDRRVKGIGPATIKSMRPYLKIARSDSRQDSPR